MPRPLQLIAVSLPPGADQAARVLEEIDRIEAGAGVRVLDVLLVSKQQDGTLVQASFGADEDLGALVSRLLPVGGTTTPNGGDAPAQLWAMADALPAESAVAFLLIEHRWAQGVLEMIGEEGGAVLGAVLLTHELDQVIDAELTAIEDTARSIAEAQAVEADAWLRAAAAQDAADEAVAASARIRSAAAAEAVRVLIDAELIERAAANEAADALRAARLVVTAADAAADSAVQADALTVAAADAATGAVLAEDAAAVAVAEEKRAQAATAASVTPAEIRVLRYLATDLTFALIADKLGISRGAAKMRAERAYRKLGVHNRDDAVKRARELRVLP